MTHFRTIFRLSQSHGWLLDKAECGEPAYVGRFTPPYPPLCLHFSCVISRELTNSPDKNLLKFRRRKRRIFTWYSYKYVSPTSELKFRQLTNNVIRSYLKENKNNINQNTGDWVS